MLMLKSTHRRIINEILDDLTEEVDKAAEALENAESTKRKLRGAQIHIKTLNELNESLDQLLAERNREIADLKAQLKAAVRLRDPKTGRYLKAD